MVKNKKKEWTPPVVQMLSIKTGTTKAQSNGKSESYGAKYPGQFQGPSSS